MSSGVVLSYGAHSVDFNSPTGACNVTVSYRFSNPLLTIDTPIQSSLPLGDNSISINIGFVTNAIDFSFDLRDGPGSFNFISPTTNFERIVYLANYVKNAKTLTLNGTAFKGQIENLRIEWAPGKKDLAEGCTMSFRLTKDIVME
ncbi:hypothetical protein CCP3SC15_420014 [Gammaproteobacteria bacterium]